MAKPTITPEEKQARLDAGHVAFAQAVKDIGSTDYRLDQNKAAINRLLADGMILVRLLPPMGGAAARAERRRRGEEPTWPVTVRLSDGETTFLDYQSVQGRINDDNARLGELSTERQSIMDTLRGLQDARRAAMDEIVFITLKMLEQGDLPVPGPEVAPVVKALQKRKRRK